MSSRVKIILRAFKGVKSKRHLIKNVINAFRHGGIRELKKAVRRAESRRIEEISDLYEKQQQRQWSYKETRIHVLFILLVEQMDADISNSIRSIEEQKYINKEIFIIAPKGYMIASEYRVLEYESHWGKDIYSVLKASKTDYVYFLRGGGCLAPNMAGEFFSDLSENDYPLIYSDECILGCEGKRYLLKADFSRFDLIYNQNIGQSIAFPRKAVLETSIIWEEINRLDDMLFELVLEISGTGEKVKHIDQIMLIHKYDYKETVEWKRALAVEREVGKCSTDARAIRHDNGIKIHKGKVEDKISLIIPAKDYETVCNCIDCILYYTDYVSYEIIVVSKAGIKEMLERRYGKNKGLIFCVSEVDSYSEKCNRGTEEASGNLLMFLSEDIAVKQRDWLYQIGAMFTFSKVGGVSPKVIREDNTIRYAGIISGGFGFTPIPFNGEVNKKKENWNEPAFCTREVSVLSATCLAVRKSIYQQIGGFNEADTRDKFSNAVLSFEIREKGFLCIYCADSTIVTGSQTWYDSWYDKEDKRAYLYLLKEYGEQLSNDPYFTESMKKQYLRGVPTTFRIYKKKIVEDSKKSILMVSHDSFLGGATIALQYAARALKNSGYFVTFLVHGDGGILKELERDHIPYIVDSSLYGNDEWMKYASNYDIIFLSTILMGRRITKLQKYNKKIVWWIHEASEYYIDVVKQGLEIKNDENLSIYCGGQYARTVFLRNFPHMKAEVLIYGLPDYASKESSVWQQADKIIFLSIGTIEQRKGQDILCEAIERLSEKERAKCKFIFVGKKIDEEVFAKIENCHERYSEIIEIAPPVSRDELMRRYEESNCVICSSREDPMPVFMTECMMKSRVPICSENTGTSGVLRDGYDGFIYCNNSPDALVDKIRYVIAHFNDMEQIGKNARKTYEEFFAMDKFEATIKHEMDKILEG